MTGESLQKTPSWFDDVGWTTLSISHPQRSKSRLDEMNSSPSGWTLGNKSSSLCISMSGSQSLTFATASVGGVIVDVIGTGDVGEYEGETWSWRGDGDELREVDGGSARISRSRVSIAASSTVEVVVFVGRDGPAVARTPLS